jgi:hypothetical protein
MAQKMYVKDLNGKYRLVDKERQPDGKRINKRGQKVQNGHLTLPGTVCTS